MDTLVGLGVGGGGVGGVTLASGCVKGERGGSDDGASLVTGVAIGSTGVTTVSATFVSGSLLSAASTRDWGLAKFVSVFVDGDV
jgi:hypothetical protein